MWAKGYLSERNLQTWNKDETILNWSFEQWKSKDSWIKNSRVCILGCLQLKYLANPGPMAQWKMKMKSGKRQVRKSRKFNSCIPEHILMLLIIIIWISASHNYDKNQPFTLWLACLLLDGNELQKWTEAV